MSKPTAIKQNPLATIEIVIRAYGQTEVVSSSMPAGQLGWHRKLRSMLIDPEREIGSLIHAAIDACEFKAMKADNIGKADSAKREKVGA